MASIVYYKPTPNLESEKEVNKYYKAHRPRHWRRLVACGGYTYCRNGLWSGTLLAKDKACAEELARTLTSLEIHYIT